MALVLESKPAQSPDTLFNAKQAAEYIGFSVAYLTRDRWIANKSGTPPQLPYFKLFGSIRYRKSDLDAVIAKGRVA